MPRRGQGDRQPRKLRPLEPRSSDDELTARRRADADEKFEDAMHNLRQLDFTVKRATRHVTITCKHNSFKRQLPWDLDAYLSDPARWANLTERIRAMHRKHCGKEV